MIFLHDLFNLDDLEAAIDNGYVRRQFHQNEPLAVLNYSELAQFERLWDEITLACRGLIYNTKTLQIVARPMKKFFNHDEPNAPVIGLDEIVSATDKMDGSLGILYALPLGGWAIATRGSFHSEQAEHATELFNRRYVTFQPADHLTYLFEIIYPENRIVCDYGDTDDLVLLGAVGINSGKIYGPRQIPAGSLWEGPRAEVFDHTTYRGALAMPPRPGKEGVVIRTDDGRMVKIKQEDYKKIHALISHLSSYSIWNNLMEGKAVEEIVEVLPDEFHGWTSGVANKIIEAKNNYIDQATSEFENIKRAKSRKEFAMLALKSSYKSALFNLYDDKSIEEMAWKNVKPSLITLGQSEDDLYAVSSSE